MFPGSELFQTFFSSAKNARKGTVQRSPGQAQAFPSGLVLLSFPSHEEASSLGVGKFRGLPKFPPDCGCFLLLAKLEAQFEILSRCSVVTTAIVLPILQLKPSRKIWVYLRRPCLTMDVTVRWARLSFWVVGDAATLKASSWTLVWTCEGLKSWSSVLSFIDIYSVDHLAW